MIVAFMNALDGENRNGRTIPITMSDPRQRPVPPPREPLLHRRAPPAQPRAQLAHPASLVSSPSRPRGRRTMMAIR